MSRRKINKAGLDLIKYFEGCELKAYKDVKGIWTIGYGHTGDVEPTQKISMAQAELLLQADIEKFEQTVESLVKPQLNDNQFAALVSLCYNIGPTNFSTSTLLKMLNKSWFDKVPDEFLRWDKSGGKVYNGLLARRRAEAELFKKAV